jgi:hypothetical protein
MRAYKIVQFFLILFFLFFSDGVHYMDPITPEVVAKAA